MSKFLDFIFCLFGAHNWVYDFTEVDAVRRPLLRRCQCCERHQIREYNGYDSGGFGPWLSL